MSDENTPRILVHWDELPEERPEMLHSVFAKKYDHESQAWLKDRGISEAWIYTIEGNRIMAWYELPKDYPSDDDLESAIREFIRQG
jgi:hypothetical protein